MLDDESALLGGELLLSLQEVVAKKQIKWQVGSHGFVAKLLLVILEILDTF